MENICSYEECDEFAVIGTIKRIDLHWQAEVHACEKHMDAFNELLSKR